MKYKNIIATISFIFLQIDLWSQSEISLAKVMYSVDKQLEFKQSKFEFIDSGVLKKSMKIKVLWNNNVFFNNYEDKDALDCFTFSTIKNDSIFIVGYMTGMFGYGFELTIINDSCIAAPFAVSDEKIYKYIPTAESYTDMILLPSTIHKVTILSKPLFKIGESVMGYIQLKSTPFYYKGFDEKFTIILNAYFKTAPLKLSE